MRETQDLGEALGVVSFTAGGCGPGRVVVECLAGELIAKIGMLFCRANAFAFEKPQPMPHLRARKSTATPRWRWCGGLSPGQFCRSLVLPLLLLIAQHGLLLHELSHVAPAPTQDGSDKHNAGGQPCELCLAFAQVASASAPAVAAAGLLAGLSFASVTPMRVAVADAALPAQRNRGPPAAL